MTLPEMSLTGAVLITVILLLRAITINRLPKQTFLILWSLALLRLLVPFTIPSACSVYSVLNRKIPEEILANLPSGIFPGRTSAESMADHSALAYNDSEQDRTASREPLLHLETDSVLCSIWGIGAALGAAFFILCYLRCRLEFSASLPVHDPCVLKWLTEHPAKRSIVVRQSDRVTTPLTYGIFRPVILLPGQTDWHNTVQLQYVLAHEYVHIRRLDAVTKLLMALALCLHWFNPLVWVMYLLYNRDLELACDETIIRQCGETSRAAYARMLIDLEAKRSGLMPLCNHFSKNAIEERITAIMKIKKLSRTVILLSAGLVIGIAAAFATSATYRSAADQTIVPADLDAKTHEQLRAETYMPLNSADTEPPVEDSADYEATRKRLTEVVSQITESERQITALQRQEEEMRAKVTDAIYQLESQIQ